MIVRNRISFRFPLQLSLEIITRHTRDFHRLFILINVWNNSIDSPLNNLTAFRAVWYDSNSIRFRSLIPFDVHRSVSSSSCPTLVPDLPRNSGERLVSNDKWKRKPDRFDSRGLLFRKRPSRSHRSSGRLSPNQTADNDNNVFRQRRNIVFRVLARRTIKSTERSIEPDILMQ